MLMKRAQNACKKDLANGEDVYLKVNTGRYKGSILLLEKVNRVKYWWYDSDKRRLRFLLNAPGLVRRLSLDPKYLSNTTECKTHLTNIPNITKKQNLPRDFVDTLIDVDDYLFGKASLIQITMISAHNYLEARCIESTNSDIKVGKTRKYRSLKRFIKIDDPTDILLRIKNEKI